MYTIKYTIPQSRFSRASKQTLKNLSKADLSCWIKWIESKLGTYEVI